MPPLSTAPFAGIGSTLGRSYNIEPQDVLRTKDVLRQTGDYDAASHGGIDGTPDRALFSGIERFQQRNGLKVDGLMRPGGETETALKSASSPATAPNTKAPPKLGGRQADGDATHEQRLRALAQRNRQSFNAQRRDALDQERAGLPRNASNVAPNGASFGPGDPPSHADPAFGAWSTPAAEQAGEQIAGMSVPAYRDQVVDAGELARWTKVLDQTDLGPNARRVLQEFFVAEGGARSHPGSTTHAGLTAGTLKNVRKKLKLDSALTPKTISPEDRVRAFVEAFTSKGDSSTLGYSGGLDALARIPDKQAATALADMMLSSPKPDTRGFMLQRSINAVAPDSVSEDGVIGAKTIDAYAALSADPRQREALLNAFADVRIADVEQTGVVSPAEFAGWRKRIDHFRFRK